MGVLGGTGSEAEACRSSQIVQLLYLMFQFVSSPYRIKIKLTGTDRRTQELEFSLQWLV